MDKKEHDYILALDLGANSIGWAVMSCDPDEAGGLKPIDVNRLGARIFEAGTTGDVEKGKDESRAIKRREARLARRQTTRRAMRTFYVYTTLAEAGMLPKLAPEGKGKGAARAARDAALAGLDKELLPAWREKLSKAGASEEDIRLLAKRFPYVLRARALDQKLTPLELGRALYHLSQRRGFQSNRKAGGKKDEDKGAVKTGIKQLGEEMASTGARTLGEYYSHLDPEEKRIRTRWTSRAMYKQEFEAIWAAQKKFHRQLLTDEFKAKLFETKESRDVGHGMFFQRPLKDQSHLIGGCEFEEGRKRAPIALLDFQRFRMLQTVNNVRILSDDYRGPRPLDPDQRARLIEALEGKTGLLDDKGVLKVSKARGKEVLGLKKNEKLNYERGKVEKFVGNRTAQAMRGIFGARWDELSHEQQEQVVEDVLTIEDDDAFTRRGVKVWGLSEKAARDLAELSLEPNYCGLSRMALKKLLPKLVEGKPYATAVAETYDPPPPETVELLPPVFKAVPALRNPAVARALSEVRKVVNAVIREHGKPTIIRIELGRDLKHGREVRKQMADRIAKNEKAREKARDEIFKWDKREAKGTEKLKYLLREECGGFCPYTGLPISMHDLFETNKFDIEHIIPFSRSLDNSFQNKTLCLHEENRKRKGNKTPWEAYSGEPDRYQQILERVEKFNSEHKDAKLRRFKMQDEDVKDLLSNFTSRQLNDTRYASRLAVQYLSMLYGANGSHKGEDGKLHVEGVDPDGKLRVQVCAGGVTAILRDEWGLNAILGDGGTKERTDHRHHAVDAVCIGFASPAVVKKIADSAESAAKEKDRNRRRFAKFEPPWPNFLEEVRQEIDKVTVSHRVSKKVNGPLHEETNYGKPREDDKGKTYVHIRKPITALSKNDLENIVDQVVRERVKTKLDELGGDFKKFEKAENRPVMDAKDGRKVPINKVRIKKAMSPMSVGKNERVRHVSAGSNHHVEIVAVTDKKGKAKWEGHVVSTFEAIRRLKANPEEPVVKREHGEGKTFKFSLALHECIQMPDESGKPAIFTVMGISPIGDSSADLEFRRTNDARLAKEIAKISGARVRKTPNSLMQSGAIKVLIDPLGNIRPAHD
jgi:CRISPR-associated endonuclease Csn1